MRVFIAWLLVTTTTFAGEARVHRDNAYAEPKPADGSASEESW